MANIDRLRGCGTAIVTPFKQDESIDESAFRRLVEFQIENGVDFIVACGTTGESVTMSEDEQARVVELTVEASEGRVPVVAGAGGYNTREVIEKVHRYERLGADAILSVTPYYNKPTQEGLYQHYRAIAESTGLPVILYSVQSRTACNIEPATVARLAEIGNIIGVKEASGSYRADRRDRVAPRRVVQAVRRGRHGRAAGRGARRDRSRLGGLEPAAASKSAIFATPASKGDSMRRAN